MVWTDEEEKIVLKAENNETFTYLGIILGIVWAIVFVLSIFTHSLGFFTVLLFIFSCLIFIPMISSVKCRKLYVTETKVVGELGILLKTRMDAPLDMITSVKLQQGFIGDAVIISTASDRYVWRTVNNADQFVRTVLKQRQRIN